MPRLPTRIPDTRRHPPPGTSVVALLFLTVFPSAQLWRGDFSADRPALALVGGAAPYLLDPEAVRRRLRELRPDSLNAQLTEPAGLWINYLGTTPASH